VLRKKSVGQHNRVNSREVIDLIRELAQVCDDAAIVGILNRLGSRTGNNNTWNKKRLQHVSHSQGIPACPPPEPRNWLTMWQAPNVGLMVGRRLIAPRILAARQVVKCAPRVIERRDDLDLPAVRREIGRVHEGRRSLMANCEARNRLFGDSGEA